jgi:hypothetical protein
VTIGDGYLDATPPEFQARATREGKTAQDIAGSVLYGTGFQLTDRNRAFTDIGITMNYLATDKAGLTWYFDVSGSFTTDRPGLVRTDTLYKTLGRAAVLAASGRAPLVLLTTNLPIPDSAGALAMRALGASVTFDAIEMTTIDGRARLREYARGGGHARPLPGFWSSKDIYGDALYRQGANGEVVSIPTAMANDPFAQLSAKFEVSELPHRVMVYLPSRKKDGEPISTVDRRVAQESIQEILMRECGGCTTQEAQGHWVDPIGGTVDEDVLVVDSYAPRIPNTAAIEELAELVIKSMDQDTAALVIDDRMLQVRSSANA